MTEVDTPEPITFESDGLQLSGDLHRPAAKSSHGLPAVVVAAGWSGRRSKSTAALATALSDAGLLALTFDFRGFGRSAGNTERLMPLEQAADITAAVTFLANRSVVDARRIAVAGILTGAAAAIHAASTDSRIGAVAAFYPFGDGGRWLRAMHRYWEWRALEAMIVADRARRATGAASRVVDADEILARGPERITIDALGRLEASADRPSRETRRLSIASAEALVRFAPERSARLISPRPVLVVAVEDDLMLPIDEARALYRRLRSPKELLVLRDVSHHQALDAEHRATVLPAVVDFFRLALDGSAGSERRG